MPKQARICKKKHPNFLAVNEDNSVLTRIFCKWKSRTCKYTPTAGDVKTWYVPLIEKMLMTYERPTERYFKHFKGGKYRFVRTALHRRGTI